MKEHVVYDEESPDEMVDFKNVLRESEKNAEALDKVSAVIGEGNYVHFLRGLVALGEYNVSRTMVQQAANILIKEVESRKSIRKTEW